MTNALDLVAPVDTLAMEFTRDFDAPVAALFRAHADTLDAGGSLHVPVLCTVANGEAPLPAHPWAKCPGCFKRQWCCCRTWCGRHCFG